MTETLKNGSMGTGTIGRGSTISLSHNELAKTKPVDSLPFREGEVIFSKESPRGAEPFFSGPEPAGRILDTVKKDGIDAGFEKLAKGQIDRDSYDKNGPQSSKVEKGEEKIVPENQQKMKDSKTKDPEEKKEEKPIPPSEENPMEEIMKKINELRIKNQELTQKQMQKQIDIQEAIANKSGGIAMSLNNELAVLTMQRAQIDTQLEGLLFHMHQAAKKSL